MTSVGHSFSTDPQPGETIPQPDTDPRLYHPLYHLEGRFLPPEPGETIPQQDTDPRLYHTLYHGEGRFLTTQPMTATQFYMVSILSTSCYYINIVPRTNADAI